jgi:hypothetical protein
MLVSAITKCTYDDVATCPRNSYFMYADGNQHIYSIPSSGDVVFMQLMPKFRIFLLMGYLKSLGPHLYTPEIDNGITLMKIESKR